MPALILVQCAQAACACFSAGDGLCPAHAVSASAITATAPTGRCRVIAPGSGPRAALHPLLVPVNVEVVDRECRVGLRESRAVLRGQLLDQAGPAEAAVH